MPTLLSPQIGENDSSTSDECFKPETYDAEHILEEKKVCKIVTPYDIIKPIYRQFEKTYDQGNGTTIAHRFFTEDGTFISFDKKTYKGYDQIASGYQVAMDAGATNFTLTPSTIYASHPFFIATGHYNCTIAAGNYQEIWKQVNQKWLLFIVIVN
ncbi:unnamed protein product [Didymodactylos carnosus]|uniref:DUF4440 domain-containing protein n=1 Tax=Didymodactylos carnosus TaxID=1234261 RepID=A0A814WT51_9BILA|nr:unnamed protein product [Didymodactylos carnosus]CAF3966885.1 unnamed protein product [Didymodactylos carnosus]